MWQWLIMDYVRKQASKFLVKIVDEYAWKFLNFRCVFYPQFNCLPQPCIVENALTMYCTAPRLSSSEFNQTSRQLQIGLLMDGVTSLLELNTTLNLHPNPVFTRFTEEMVFTSGDPIPLTIRGEGFVFDSDQVNVLIKPCNSDRGCLCTVMNVFSNNNVSV